MKPFNYIIFFNLDKTINEIKYLEYMKINVPDILVDYIGMDDKRGEHIFRYSTDYNIYFLVAGLATNTFLKLNDSTII